ncbi:MAG: hypothetical protein JWQ96_2687 [Segetibacter sp.]|nr:hypothetical protein [Segetibacter sp.]
MCSLLIPWGEKGNRIKTNFFKGFFATTLGYFSYDMVLNKRM